MKSILSLLVLATAVLFMGCSEPATPDVKKPDSVSKSADGEGSCSCCSECTECEDGKTCECTAEKGAKCDCKCEGKGSGSKDEMVDADAGDMSKDDGDMGKKDEAGSSSKK